jgi:2-succinyl-6-hydroxy-2,4-cyclohexadiene-1-carboxylate synthase
MGCGDDWRETIARLGDSFSRLTVDLPGHGRSIESLSTEQYSMPGCAELVLSLLDNLGITKCHLVAYSMGGRLGLYLLTHYPERFGRAVIESSSPGLKTKDEREARRAADRELQERILTAPLDKLLTEWYSQPLFSTMDQADPRYAALLQRRLGNNPEALALSLENMGTGAQPSLWEELEELTRETLFVAGERDQKYGAIAEEMTGLCPAGQVAIIPGAGHNVHFERPVEFCSEVSRFLTENEL